MSEWISVKDRLPMKNDRVLVYRPEMKESDVGAVSVQFGWNCRRKKTDITHWMPLPAPPGEGNNVPNEAPNDPLTLEDAKKERYIWFTPLNDWAKVTPFGVLFFGSEELMNWETLCEEWGYRFKAYRRPPEVSP